MPQHLEKIDELFLQLEATGTKAMEKEPIVSIHRSLPNTLWEEFKNSLKVLAATSNWYPAVTPCEGNWLSTLRTKRCQATACQPRKLAQRKKIITFHPAARKITWSMIVGHLGGKGGTESLEPRRRTLRMAKTTGNRDKKDDKKLTWHLLHKPALGTPMMSGCLTLGG